MIEINVLIIDPELSPPSYARTGDAGADLVARVDVRLEPAGGRALVPTGIALAIPSGYAGLVAPRSGLAARHGVTCVNAPGTIDSGYRGEIHVALINTDPHLAYEVHRGDRIAQLLIVEVESAAFRVVEALDETDRSEGAFGHSGR